MQEYNLNNAIGVSCFKNSLFLLFLYSILCNYSRSGPVYFLTNALNDIRCSHVPPPPEQITHVWLENLSEFVTTNNKDVNSNDQNQDISRPFTTKTDSIKSKRDVNSSAPNLLSPQTTANSMWNTLKKLSMHQSSYLSKEDLVPMKIHIHYDNSVNLLEKAKLQIINTTVMPSVVKFFESVLSIKRENKIDTFRMTRRCPNNTIYYAKDFVGIARPYCMDRCEDYAICGEVIVPKNHLSACSYCNSTSKRCTTNYSTDGEGIDEAQLVLYVSAKQTARCKKDQTIAYAAHCAQDSKTDRPVAGHANLCPSSISTDPKDLKALIATVKHELTHVLGFSVSLFAYYRDEFGLPLTERDSTSGPIMSDPITGYAKWSEKVIKKVIRQDWVTGEGRKDKEVHLIVTPTVVREVRNHFNCSTLEGAELEDQGFDGTSMTHWEKRLFENEAMTGTHTQNSVYSRLTLAILQDTGWYIANFSKAEKLEWGKDLGCEFAKKSCKSWIDNRRAEGKSIRPFCDRIKNDLLQIACTEDRSSKAVCNMKQYKEPLPLAYQNFEQLDGISKDGLAYFGGSVDLADYCPFIQEFTWQTQNVSVRGSRCDLVGSNHESDRNAALEYYGPQTKCFEHSRRWEQRSCVYKRHWHHYGAGCYKYLCSNDLLKVIVGNYTYSCYYPNQILKIEQVVDQWLYNGTIICPVCEKICSKNKCKVYDKQLIDELININNELSISTDMITKEALSVLVDDAINLIETTNNQLESKGLNNSKQKSIINSYPIKMKEDLDYKDRLLELLSKHKEPPRHMLICSSSQVIGSQVVILIILLIISLLKFFECRLDLVLKVDNDFVL